MAAQTTSASCRFHTTLLLKTCVYLFVIITTGNLSNGPTMFTNLLQCIFLKRYGLWFPNILEIYHIFNTVDNNGIFSRHRNRSWLFWQPYILYSNNIFYNQNDHWSYVRSDFAAKTNAGNKAFLAATLALCLVSFCHDLKTYLLNMRMPAARFHFIHLIFHSYDYNMHVEGLVPANLCLVTLLSSEQC